MVRSESPEVPRWADLGLFVAAILVIPALILEDRTTGGWHVLGRVLDTAIWIAFVCELIYLLAHASRRWWWLWHHPMEVGVVVLTPPFAPPFLQAWRALRALRVLRLTRTAQIVRRVISPDGLAWAAILTALTVLGGGIAFADVENSQHLSARDGAWWALTTLTTVGYGDITPKTGSGKVIASVVMVVGIGFVALLTAAVAERFVTNRRREVGSPEFEMAERVLEMSERLERIEAAVLADADGRRTPAGGGPPGRS
jgi:voltage-gated potassium channel